MNGPRMAPQAQIQKVHLLLIALIIQILLIPADISKIFSPVKNFFITENKKKSRKILYLLSQSDSRKLCTA